jgi:hypothetical protein
MPDLPALARCIADEEGISLSDLLGKDPSLRRDVSSVKLHSESSSMGGASMARFVGVSTSLVNRIAETAVDLDGWVESSL